MLMWETYGKSERLQIYHLTLFKYLYFAREYFPLRRESIIRRINCMHNCDDSAACLKELCHEI